VRFDRVGSLADHGEALQHREPDEVVLDPGVEVDAVDEADDVPACATMSAR
jgi:hypothetical protein